MHWFSSPTTIGEKLLVMGSHYANLSAVSVDDVGVGRMAVQHLLGLGHRTIAYLGRDPDQM